MLMKKIALIAGMMIMLSACSSAPVRESNILSPITIGFGQPSKSVTFEKGVVKLSRGTKVGSIQIGLLCIPHYGLNWKGGKLNFTSDEMIEVFNEELEKSNYNVVGDTGTLFKDKDKESASILVAALVTTIEANTCYPHAGFGNWSQAKGELYLEVEWQVFSKATNDVIYKKTTSGSSKLDQATPTGQLDILYDAFSIATNNLLADSEFNKILIP
jgi:hypothetical protein